MPVSPPSINLLGHAELHLADSPPVPRLQNKVLALLAYLAVESRDHTRDTLSSLLWPELPTQSARANLRKTVFKLHQLLGDTLPKGNTDTLSIPADAVQLDVAQFFGRDNENDIAALERKAGLYRGLFLDGLALDGCGEFEDWLCIKREVCHRHAIKLFERLGECLEQSGEITRALACAQRHLSIEPGAESAHRRVMRLLAQSGQVAAALDQFEVCRHLLWHEQGLEPDRETCALSDAIRAGEIRPAMLSAAPTLPRAERRQVTALYCGITTRGELDPEELAERWLALQQEIYAVIRQFGGHVSQTHGGGVLGYFGYPVAQEDAARRAVRAALAIGKLAGATHAIASGVHTGMVVSSTDLPDSMGLTSTVAAEIRDMNHAVTISAATLHLVSGYFFVEAAGSRPSPGGPLKTAIYRVNGETGAQYRLESLETLTPYVGRADEIATLHALWQQARAGRCRVALVSGEPGIGKSRLVHVLKEQLAQQQHAIREMRCFPEFTRSPFHPVIIMLEAVFEFAANDDEPTRKRKLAQHLDAHFPQLVQTARPLLEELLGLVQMPPGHKVGSAQQQKEQVMTMLLDLLYALAVQHPVLLVIEDLHWIDPSTLELLTAFVRHTGCAHILALLTARPKFQPAWRAELDADIVLHGLDAVELEKMVATLAPELDRAVKQDIVARAGGIPLFAEEMAKRLADENAVIPATLQDLLTVELDRLGPAKRTAQLAATIGREFDLALLQAISDGEVLLTALHNAGLVYPHRTGYQFKHALIQEAAYQSQTRSDRQAAHRCIAEALCKESDATLPEILAYHWAACGEARLAVENWIAAGKKAMQQSAAIEAVAHFRAGLKALALLPEGSKRDRLEFSLQAGLGVVLQATQGYGSEEATQANLRAAALSGCMDDSAELFRAQWTQVLNTIAGLGAGAAIESARQLFMATSQRGEAMQVLAAHHVLADAAFWFGDFESAYTHSECVIALYRPEQHDLLVEQFGEDLQIASLAYFSWSAFFLDRTDEARRACQKMLDRARMLNHPHTLALALCFAAVLHRWLDQPAETLALGAETIVVSQQHGFPVWLAAGEMTHGWALVRQGESGQGLAELHSSIVRMRMAIGGLSCVFLSALVEAHVFLRQTDAALEVIAEAFRDIQKTGDGHFTAELYRLQGECLLMRGGDDRSAAAACLGSALDLSRKQRAKAIERRVLKSRKDYRLRLADLMLRRG